MPNEDILKFLAENKRYGIPYNSVHGPNNIEGIILPEILTVKTLLNTIKQVKEWDKYYVGYKRYIRL